MKKFIVITGIVITGVFLSCEKREDYVMPDLSWPPNNIEIFSNKVELYWNKIDDVDNYIVNITLGDTVILEKEVKGDTVYVFSSEENGTFLWKVGVIYEGGDTIVWSNPAQFTIDVSDSSKKYETPVLLFPEDSTSISDSSITFIWQNIKNEEKEYYVFKISHKGDAPVLFGEIKDTFFKYNIPSSGEYEWSVGAVYDSSGQKLLWSEERIVYYNFSTPGDDTLLVTPPQHLKIPYPYFPASVKFKWTEKDVEEYILEIAYDNNFKDIVIDTTVNSSSVNYIFSELKEGTLYWHIVYKINDDSILTSETREINVEPYEDYFLLSMDSIYVHDCTLKGSRYYREGGYEYWEDEWDDTLSMDSLVFDGEYWRAIFYSTHSEEFFERRYSYDFSQIEIWDKFFPNPPPEIDEVGGDYSERWIEYYADTLFIGHRNSWSFEDDYEGRKSSSSSAEIDKYIKGRNIMIKKMSSSHSESSYSWMEDSYVLEFSENEDSKCYLKGVYPKQK